MIDVFFSGYGYWFYKHKRNQQLYTISCTHKSPVLMPLPGSEMHCFNPIESIGYFSLTRNDELAYESPQSLLTVKNLIPLPEPLMEHSGRSTFLKITENLQLGFTGINADDCVFIIDNDQPFEIKFDARNNYIAGEYTNPPNEITKKKKIVSERVYQNIIAVLLEIIVGAFPGFDKHPCFISKMEFINTMDAFLIGRKNVPSNVFYDFKAIDEHSDKKSNSNKKWSDSMYLQPIGAMLLYINGGFPNIKKHPNFINQGRLEDKISQKYFGFCGLSKSYLSRIFPTGKKSLE